MADDDDDDDKERRTESKVETFITRGYWAEIWLSYLFVFFVTGL